MYNTSIIVANKYGIKNMYRGYLVSEDQFYYSYYDFIHNKVRKIYKEDAYLRRPKTNIIYLITCTKTNKKYIGRTSTSLLERLNAHFSKSKCSWNKTELHKDMTKYGKDCFNIEKIDEVVAEDCKIADALEQSYIQKYKTYVPLGYNMLVFGGKYNG